MSPTVALLRALSLLALASPMFVPRRRPAGVAGGAIAVTGAVIVWKSRVELGPAWSLVPKARDQTGFMPSGPYRRVRHPIYLGLSLVAIGQAVAFESAPALLIVLTGVIPSFVWRAFAEERVLVSVFGEQYVAYRQQTKMFVPYVLSARLLPFWRVNGG